jgi:hypothetical protein
MLRSVVDSARAASGTVVLEKVCPDLPEERLPPGSGPRPACPPLLRFVANEVKGRVEIIVQDVTRLRWLEATPTPIICGRWFSLRTAGCWPPLPPTSPSRSGRWA